MNGFDLNFRHFQAFVTVARLNSFTRAEVFRSVWKLRDVFHSTVFHLNSAPPLRAGLGPVAVAVTGPGTLGLVAR